MATVFMKWLETRPRDYERGIRLLTLGRLPHAHQALAGRIQPGMRVLELGCGTGALTAALAARGAQVDAVDASPLMLGEAERRLKPLIAAGQVRLHHLDATQIADRFPPQSFDAVVASLLFSELPPEEQRYVLDACRDVLTADGRLLILDEVRPQSGVGRALYALVRLPLVLLTWLLTRTTTHGLDAFPALLAQSGFRPTETVSWLGGSLVLYAAQPAPAEMTMPVAHIPRLRHRVTLRTLLTDLWCLFFRIVPPYPKVRPGLYAIGHPDPHAPLLVTGNFDLTVRRLVRALDGQVDCWLLVADSAGINVWCAAGGGFFTAEKVLAALNAFRVRDVVAHHRLILPQLCANGVDGWRLRQAGWGVHWGPVRAQDIPAYLAAGGHKTEAMRRVDFPLKARLEMVTVTLGFYALLILLPVFLWWRHLFWPVTAALLGLSYFYAVTHPWLPGRDGLWKSIPLSLIALAGLAAYSLGWGHLAPPALFRWTLGLIGLSVFTGGELQGMSPLMRGEQANWGAEAVIGVLLLAVYLLGKGWFA